MVCLRNNEYQGSQICIVTGPNIDIAIKLIKRLKALFEERHRITFNNKETVLELNRCTIEAFPSNHLDSYRALDNPKFIFIDESDFFRKVRTRGCKTRIRAIYCKIRSVHSHG